MTWVSGARDGPPSQGGGWRRGHAGEAIRVLRPAGAAHNVHRAGLVGAGAWASRSRPAPDTPRGLAGVDILTRRPGAPALYRHASRRLACPSAAAPGRSGGSAGGPPGRAVLHAEAAADHPRGPVGTLQPIPPAGGRSPSPPGPSHASPMAPRPAPASAAERLSLLG